MPFARRLIWIALGLAVLFAASFAVWGDGVESLLTTEHLEARLEAARGTAWLWAIALLIGDLLLPIPATTVMTALGAVYGVVLGALIGAVGSMLAGWIGYGLARWGGRRMAERLAEPGEIDRLQAGFDRWGGLAVIVSRAFPILPEVVSILAGLARMHPGRFGLALALGAIPLATFFAALGSWARSAPFWGTLVSLLVPALLYAAVAWQRKR